jgi:hypothetical protein
VPTASDLAEQPYSIPSSQHPDRHARADEYNPPLSSLAMIHAGDARQRLHARPPQPLPAAAPLPPLLSGSTAASPLSSRFVHALFPRFVCPLNPLASILASFIHSPRFVSCVPGRAGQRAASESHASAARHGPSGRGPAAGRIARAGHG